MESFKITAADNDLGASGSFVMGWRRCGAAILKAVSGSIGAILSGLSASIAGPVWSGTFAA